MDGRDASTGTWTGNRSAPSLPPSDGLMSEIVATTPKDQLGPAPARRGEALTELARRHLDSGAAPTDHDNRPHLTAIIDWHTLTGDKPEGRSEYLDGTFLRPEDTPQVGLRRPHMPAHHRPHSEILDLERTRRTASPAGTTTPGPPPPVPRLSPPHHLVRRPPHPLLVATPRPHKPRQPHPPLPTPPHPHPPTKIETPRHRHPPPIHPTRRHHPPQRTPTPKTRYHSRRNGPVGAEALIRERCDERERRRRCPRWRRRRPLLHLPRRWSPP